MDGLAHAAVAAEPPCVPLADIASAVSQQYGIDGKYAPLISERDQNYHVSTAAGPDFVVKVASSAEPAITSAFQISALLHLDKIETPRVPKVVRTLGGRAWCDIEHAGIRHCLRVVSYLPGVPLASVHLRRHLARELGVSLACLDRGLMDFSHDGEQRALLWDMQRAPELRELLQHIDKADVRRSVTHALNDYETVAAPLLGSLRNQVIHGDVNPSNVLLEPRDRHVDSIIDFGDMVRAPLIFEVAIAAAYLRPVGEDPLDLIVPFVAAYNAAIPLEDMEIALLFDLIRTRLATTITLLFWRMGARREDDPYRKKTLDGETDAIRFMAALDGLGRAECLERLRPVRPRQTTI